MKMQVSAAGVQGGGLSVNSGSMVLLTAIALLLSACSPSFGRTPLLKPSSSGVEDSLLLSDVSQTAERQAVEQAVLADPRLNAALQEAATRSPESPVIPLQTGAIAIAENYALAHVSGGVGDLPVIDGYYLLMKQNGQWLGVDFVGIWGEVERDRLVALNVPDDIIHQLIASLAAEANEPVWVVTASTIARDQVVLGGISPEMTMTEVRQRLGEPLSTKVEETGCCGALIYWEYPTLSLGFTEEGNIWHLGTTYPDVPTAAGVQVGDDYETVIAAYGSPSRADGQNMVYYIDGSEQTESLAFGLITGRVVSIGYSALLN